MTQTKRSDLDVQSQQLSGAEVARPPEVSVCVCTMKRPELLRRTLASLENQETRKSFSYAVVVADNDATRSAEPTVAEFAASVPFPVTYCVEPKQNIALARNQAIAHATGEFIAFIDDDEFVAKDWLLNLFNTCQSLAVDGVLGPVKPHFDQEPPQWVKRGGFFDRPDHPTGYAILWKNGRTGNVLFRRSVLKKIGEPFRKHFQTAGEDVDFFRRVIEEQGHRFVWCTEAIAWEVVPASRCTRSYLLRRALLRGSNFSKHPTHRFRTGLASMIAVPCYAVALPLLLLFGEHVFLKYLIKLLDHLSRLFAYLGISLITQRQT
jgi:succinoglycan biosynthesis protein ExoM